MELKTGPVNMAMETLQTSTRSNAVPLHGKARDNLQFIRDTMEGASAFTSISGAGLVGAGVVGIATSLGQSLLGISSASGRGIILWLCALGVAFCFSTAMTMSKAKRQGTRLWSVSGKKLLYAFSPTMVVGGIITIYTLAFPADIPLPAIWLSLYGAAIMTAGAYSIVLLRIMGAIFIALGTATFFTPVSENLMMGIGFGGLHIISGLTIWKRHGG